MAVFVREGSTLIVKGLDISGPFIFARGIYILHNERRKKGDIMGSLKDNFNMSNEEYYNTFMQLRQTLCKLMDASSVGADWRKLNKNTLIEMDRMIDRCNYSSMHWNGSKDDIN